MSFNDRQSGGRSSGRMQGGSHQRDGQRNGQISGPSDGFEGRDRSRDRDSQSHNGNRQDRDRFGGRDNFKTRNPQGSSKFNNEWSPQGIGRSGGKNRYKQGGDWHPSNRTSNQNQQGDRYSGRPQGGDRYQSNQPQGGDRFPYNRKEGGHGAPRRTEPDSMFYRDRVKIPTSLQDLSSASLAHHLCACKSVPKKVPSVDSLIQTSRQFWEKFTTDNPRLFSILEREQESKATLQEYVGSVYPLLHHTTVALLLEYIQHVQKYGNSIEKAVYKDMDIIKLVDRLIKKRPLAFLGRDDKYLLGIEYKFRAGKGDDFVKIGTPDEEYPLKMENFLSYDEMRIAALLSVSSWSAFINNGWRKNMGDVHEKGSYQPNGVICGQVGCRFTRRGFMDYPDCMVTQDLNVAQNGFGRSCKDSVHSVWGRYWGHTLPTYEEAESVFKDQKTGKRSGNIEFVELSEENALFNVTVYKKRIMVTAEVLLCEAAARAEKAQKKAYVHVVGLGLGVWRAFPQQDALYVEAWGEAIRDFKNKSHISVIDFSWIEASDINGTKHGAKFPDSDITIRISQRNLHDHVPADCILVCNYAWDGNSLPGNEFWFGKMCATGDSAAAASSQVAELQNHYINPLVEGNTLHVATPQGTVVHWTEYAKSLSGKFGLEVEPSKAPVATGSQVVQLQGKGVWSRLDSEASPSEASRAPVDPETAPSDISMQEAPKVEIVPPEKIRHPTVLGVMIDNPEYLAYVKRQKKAEQKEKKAKRKAANETSQGSEKQTEDPQESVKSPKAGGKSEKKSGNDTNVKSNKKTANGVGSTDQTKATKTEIPGEIHKQPKKKGKNK